ncbi:MAG TPA: LysR family transcriptional regulator [Sphingomicrobium sp.]|jgi:DNA-binding transcriptional LysR family regulator|nr:LysR family transcriptional regulator [Sphingomicrobium sp.]
MDWDDLDIFCHVIDHGSFSGAARVLRRPKSSVSASVARLEARLGTRVIERTTRRLRLTEAGESLYREMAPLFGNLREALGNAAAKGRSVSGRLRIAAPYEFGAHHLGAVACAMLADHPELEVDIDVEHQPVNLFDQQYDIVFTMIDKGVPSTSGAVRRVFSLARGLFASPDMLNAIERPQTPYDLRHLPLLAAASDTEWTFTDAASGHHAVPVAAPRLRSSNAGIRLQAALEGLGVARITATYCEPAVEAGRLERILPDFECAPLRVYALLPARRLMPIKVRIFLDTLESMSRTDSH